MQPESWARFYLVTVIAAVVLVVNRLAHFDSDAGGYRPALGNRASYPKAYVHGVTAFASSLAAIVFVGGAPVSCALLVILAAALWEFTQGFFNWLDVLAGAIGATAASALFLLSA